MVIRRLREQGLKDNVTGDIYLSKRMMRRVLGTFLRIPRGTQYKIINELKNKGLINVTKRRQTIDNSPMIIIKK